MQNIATRADSPVDQAERTGSGTVPYPTTRAEAEHYVALPVFSASGPNLAGLLQCGRGSAYELIRKGVVPSRRIGSKILCPTVPLLAWLDNA
jgi:hypothetical protein